MYRGAGDRGNKDDDGARAVRAEAVRQPYLTWRSGSEL